uniref:PAN-3 domain-containing protein n=1 Tax=Caenorhabditis japonica TaxID=281687 RepID=A0A8R1I539_CAEJA
MCSNGIIAEEPIYKFGVLAGEPASLDGSKSVSVGSWEECVEECESDFECILASQKSPGQCNLFPWNTVSDVKKKESGGEEMVAFRLYTNEPSCELNLPTLLHGRTYPLYPNITEEYLWRIDTLDDGYHITYMKTVQEDKMVCGNWSWNRPYADGCNPECRLSMIQLYAEPGELANPLRNFSSTNWDDCVQECYQSNRCVVVYFDEETTKCGYHQVDDILHFVQKATADSGKRGAIKVNLNNETCKYTTEQLLNDTYYPLYPNITEEYMWRIDTLDDGYNITYLKTVQEDNMVCGNWSWNRPYADGCNPECRLSMIQLYAEPGELANPLRNFSSTNWDDCVQECYQSNRCVVVYFNEETTKCGYHEAVDVLHFVQKATADSGKRGAIKVNLNNETCKYTTEQLLNGTYYMMDNSTLYVDVFWGVMDNVQYPNRLTFWSIRTYEEHYVVMFYHDEKYSLYSAQTPRCPINLFPIEISSPLSPIQPLCYRPFIAPNITQVRAKTLCNRLGLDLMPAVYYEFAGPIRGKIAVRSNLMPAWSFPGNRNWNVWVGLERDNQCVNKSNAYCSGNQQWQYSNPSLAIIYYQSPRDTIDFYWGTNEPDMSADKCNTTEVDINGFYCASESQKYLLYLPKYADVAASYGYVDYPPYGPIDLY